MSTFSEADLEAGLDSFLQPASKKRRTEAIEYFRKEVLSGAPQPTALDNALMRAVSGLSNKEQKLSKAREAAGVHVSFKASKTPDQPPLKIVAPVTTTKTVEPIKAPTTETTVTTTNTTTETTHTPRGLLGATVLGLVIGLIIGFMVALWVSNIYSGNPSIAPYSGIVYWVVLLFTAAVFAFGFRAIRAHVLRKEYEHTNTSSTTRTA